MSFIKNLDSFSTGPELNQTMNTVHKVWFHGSAKISAFCFPHGELETKYALV